MNALRHAKRSRQIRLGTDAALAGHLASCPECVAYADDMREPGHPCTPCTRDARPALDMPSSLYADGGTRAYTSARE